MQPIRLIRLLIEEKSVREAAVESTKSIVADLPQIDFTNEYDEMLSDLVENEWFTGRMSAAYLIAPGYPRFSRDQQAKLLQGFLDLSKDEIPMVRRIAAQNVGPMLEAVAKVHGRACFEEEAIVVTMLMPLYEGLASTDQPVSVNVVGTDGWMDGTNMTLSLFILGTKFLAGCSMGAAFVLSRCAHSHHSFPSYQSKSQIPNPVIY